MLLFEATFDASMSIPKLRTCLFLAICESAEDVAYNEELYKKDPKASGVQVDEDLELLELLEELAFDDFANAQEMKDYKSELGKDAVRRLQKRRRECRAELFSVNQETLHTNRVNK